MPPCLRERERARERESEKACVRVCVCVCVRQISQSGHVINNSAWLSGTVSILNCDPTHLPKIFQKLTKENQLKILAS